MDPVGVQLPGPDVGQVAVPHHVRAFGQGDARRFLNGMGRIEEAQIDLRRVVRVDGEIDTESGPGSPEGVRLTWPDAHAEQLFKNVADPSKNGS